MDNVSDCIEFVKKQVEYQDRRATMTRKEPKKLHFHLEEAKRFRSLLQFLETLSNKPLPIKQPTSSIDPIAPLLPKELVGLPQELIDELSAKATDKQELLITELIDSHGGTLSLDRILVGIYAKSGVIMKRSVLNAKLYRMIKKEMVYAVPKKKGIYTTNPTLAEKNKPADTDPINNLLDPYIMFR